MPGNVLVDFYHGWMIEITSAEAGFLGVCCSPRGKRIYDRTPHPNHLKAWQAAMTLIDYASACITLKRLLRDMYESGDLQFDEWQLLSSSLAKALGSID